MMMEAQRRARHKPVTVHPKGVFCLENEWFGLRSTVSVLPALKLLHDSDYRVPFIHRDVATRAELEHYVRKWFQGRQDGFEVLWLAMHSRRGLLKRDARRGRQRLAPARSVALCVELPLAGRSPGREQELGEEAAASQDGPTLDVGWAAAAGTGSSSGTSVLGGLFLSGQWALESKT